MTVVNLSAQARRDLSDLVVARGLYSDEAALRLADAFDEVVERLMLFPESGSPRPALGTDVRMLAMTRFGLVVYTHTLRREAVAQVLVLRVVPHERDIDVQDIEAGM